MTGIVQMYVPLRGYGFIIGDPDGPDFKSKYFFHISHFNGSEVPTRGLRVDFDLGPGLNPGSIQAIKVVPAVQQ